jgi:hypothetical protein
MGKVRQVFARREIRIFWFAPSFAVPADASYLGDPILPVIVFDHVLKGSGTYRTRT